jgi:aminopeptidase-like protein
MTSSKSSEVCVNVVNYSVPVHQHLRLAELRQHLFALPAISRLDPVSRHLLPRELGILLA